MHHFKHDDNEIQRSMKIAAVIWILIIVVILFSYCTACTATGEYTRMKVQLTSISTKDRCISGQWLHLYECWWKFKRNDSFASYEYDTTGLRLGMAYPAFVKR